MITPQDWKRLSTEQRANAIIKQVEWLVFQASMRGLDIDRRSLCAVLETKRSMLCGKATRQILNVKWAAYDVFQEEGGMANLKRTDALREVLDSCSLAFVCYCLAEDIFNGRIDYWNICEYILSFDNLPQKNPITNCVEEATVV